MGWIRTLLLGDWGNRMDIADNEDRIRHLQRHRRSQNRDKRAKDRTQDEQIASLEEQVESMEMAIAAIGSLLLSKEVCSMEELSSIVDVIEPKSE